MSGAPAEPGKAKRRDVGEPIVVKWEIVSQDAPLFLPATSTEVGGRRRE
jgi:hypothetical protein